MKKITLLLILLLSLGLIGCSSTSYLASPSPQVTIGGESYDWKKWDCYDRFGDGKYLLRIGYVPEISDSKGILFLKGSSDSGINTTHSLRGVQHFWKWDSYTIVIESDGTGYFYDDGNPTESYKCYN